jgi:hypothetical protein
MSPLKINVREYRRGNQKWIIQRTWQHYTRRKQTKQKHKTICVAHHYSQTNTNNVNKTLALLQTTEGKDEPNIVLRGNRNGHHITHNMELRT